MGVRLAHAVSRLVNTNIAIKAAANPFTLAQHLNTLAFTRKYYLVEYFQVIELCKSHAITVGIRISEVILRPRGLFVRSTP